MSRKKSTKETKHGKPGRGRGTFSFKEEMRTDFLTAIRGGASVETAAAYVGISRPTVHKWLKNGSADRAAEKESTYATFHQEFEQSLAHCEIRAVLSMKSSGAGDWRMWMTFLERRFHERWMKRQAIALPNEDDMLKAADAHDLDNLSDDQLDELEKLLAKTSD